MPCTCGHRANPYRWWNLDDLRDTSDINAAGYSIRPVDSESLLPADWPDHYSINDRHPKKRIEKKIYHTSDTELEAVLALIQSQESEL